MLRDHPKVPHSAEGRFDCVRRFDRQRLAAVGPLDTMKPDALCLHGESRHDQPLITGRSEPLR